MKSNDLVSSGSIMVLSAASGAGHIRAALALVKAFALKGISAEHIEVLRYTNIFFRQVYSDLYIDFVNKRPDLVGWMYNSLDRPWKMQKRRLALDRLNTGKLIKLLDYKKPEIVICTHFLPAEILIYLRKKRSLDIKIGVVVTDFDAHAMWLYKNVDWYFVACEETREYLSELGIPRNTIHVTGIPIDPVFAVKKSKDEIRKKLGLLPDRNTLLISAGGFGVGPIESLAESVNKVTYPIQMIIVCGKNNILKQRLENINNFKHPVKIIGFTNEMDELMAASNILIGKSGGLTSSEALARDLIMVIVNPIPGQEQRNSDHFLEEGVAIRCNNLPTLAYKIDKLLNDKNQLEKMKQSIKTIAKPDSASEIVSIVLQKEKNNEK
ncbi:glycosyltransferase [Candidatus Desantisbacteria bacterium]|nr:glycosyltransferase [Candidatus Desantisbacteria bacterium]